MAPKVSLLIPVYNVAPYINRCIQSIVAQTYQSIECIFIDDCGTDGSMQFVDKFIRQYKGNIHFTLISHKQNMGLSVARNTGIRSALGDYIYFMDSDDAITPNCIETLTNLAEKYPSADYIQGDTVTGNEQLMVGVTDLDVPEFCDEKRFLERIILCKTHRTAWNKLIKRSFLIDNSLFFPIGLLMEDHYWTYFVAKHAHAVAFTHKGTYYYYKNNNSLVNATSKTSLIKRYSSYMTVTDTIIRDMLHRNDIQPCHRTYVGEALLFCMINLHPLHSLFHWMIFWKFAFITAWKVRTNFTWQRMLFFICTIPPLCFMIGIKGWRWRLRQYLLTKI